MNLVEVRDVHKHYGSNHILKGVNLDVNMGEVKAIIGPSGSGKSTLLRLVALLEPIDKGSIRIDGRLLASVEDGNRIKDSEKELAHKRAGIGMVFQKFNLFPHLSAIDNVALALTTVQKMDRVEALDISAAMLKRVGLSERVKFFPSELSGGQQQRVAIARALVLQPKLMLFDEPTSALDPELVREVLNVIEQLAADGMTMLLVTHEIGLARKIANEVVMFDDGEIVEAGAPEQIFTNAQHNRTRKFLEHVL